MGVRSGGTGRLPPGPRVTATLAWAGEPGVLRPEREWGQGVLTAGCGRGGRGRSRSLGVGSGWALAPGEEGNRLGGSGARWGCCGCEEPGGRHQAGAPRSRGRCLLQVSGAGQRGGRGTGRTRVRGQGATPGCSGRVLTQRPRVRPESHPRACGWSPWATSCGSSGPQTPAVALA